MNKTNLFIALFVIFIMIVSPRVLHRTAYQSIDEKQFKLYKIKKFGFLFKGMQGESASTYGVILPMLIIQIQGYILGLLSLCLFVANEMFAFFKDPATVVTIIIITAFIDVFISILVEVITGFVSKKRKKKKRK